MAERTNVTNMFSGSPLNRLSWLRTSHLFLNAIIVAPSTRWILFNHGQPLVVIDPNSSQKQTLAFLTTKDIRPLLGSEPIFGQGEQEGQLVIESPDVKYSPTEAARHLNSPVVFLGFLEDRSSNALPSSEYVDPDAAAANLKGTAYFTMDIVDLNFTEGRMKEILDTTDPVSSGKILSWSEPRVLMTGLDHFSGAIFAEARSLVDWNQRNKFCAGCGSSTYSMWGGWKLSCRSLLPWAKNRGSKPCPTSKGLHNFTHPRTDPVVIMIAIDEAGDKILLGRGKKYPGKFYSALAGFVEPGECFEDAVAREMWEEAGVTVWDIKYHSGQPWPYPANIMVGFYVRADSSQAIRLDLDNELVDARWFTRDEVAAVLEHPTGARLGRADYKKFSDSEQGSETTSQSVDTEVDEPPFKLPPTTAIAGVLIRDWVDRKIGFTSQPTADLSLQRNNL